MLTVATITAILLFYYKLYRSILSTQDLIGDQKEEKQLIGVKDEILSQKQASKSLFQESASSH